MKGLLSADVEIKENDFFKNIPMSLVFDVVD